jgi:predicted ribosome quality control (RQC) complex YloA/Tae2 family protein
MHDAKRAAPRDVSLPQASSSAPGTGKRKQGEAKRTPFRTFHARSGRKILVGKGAADNDALTQKTARPHDLWLHAKDRTGAHVIVPLDKNQSCPQGDLVDAAHLAAHFSDAREEKVVDVQYTQRRHLRKPKGSAPGLVVVDREKVLVLRVEPETLRALLEREET